jgi:hypothetical protein
MARRRCVTWHWRMPGASAEVHVGVLISELNPPRLASLGCHGDGLLPAAAEGVQGNSSSATEVSTSSWPSTPPHEPLHGRHLPDHGPRPAPTNAPSTCSNRPASRIADPSRPGRSTSCLGHTYRSMPGSLKISCLVASILRALRTPACSCP